MEVACARPHHKVPGCNGFEVVVEHVRTRRHDPFQRSLLAKEVGGQHLDRRVRRASADGPDHGCKMGATAVREIITVDRCDDHMLQAQLGYRLRDLRWLSAVERLGPAGLHVAKRASARASIAHDHEGGMLFLPTLSDIGTSRLLADRDELVLPDDASGLGPAWRAGRPYPDPVGLAQDRLVRPMRLLGMTRARRRDRI